MTASFPPDVRHRNLERLVVEVVRTAIDREGKRLLLIVEDAQWMNQLSMKLLLKASKNVCLLEGCLQAFGGMLLLLNRYEQPKVGPNALQQQNTSMVLIPT